MEWIGEVEIAKSLGEVQTSASIIGKTMLPDLEILCSQRASTEESEAQKKGGHMTGARTLG